MSLISALILAAGQGKRMKSNLPKVLHQAAGLPLIAYPVKLAYDLKIRPTLVVGKGQNLIQETLKKLSFKNLSYAVQHPPLGTGDAVRIGIKKISSKTDDLLILSGDMPLIQKESIQKLIKHHRQSKAAISFLTAITDERGEYGRVIRNSKGHAEKIVEVKDATPTERKIREINIGIYLISLPFLKQNLVRISTHNKQKEYYLTDLIHLAYQQNKKIVALPILVPHEAFGVNTRQQLMEVENIIYQNRMRHWTEKGVRFIKGNDVILDPNVQIGAGTLIDGPHYSMGQTSIGKNCLIEPGVFIRDSTIKNNVHIKAYSYIDQSKIEDQAEIGPFSHLRPLAHIGVKAKVGNFSEVKKSKIGKGSKVNHLSYIGDAEIGQGVNVGAGTITCNYDGINKFKTILEDHVFVGSDTQFVAPVRVGKGAVIGAGTTITKDVKPYSLALSRTNQTEIKGWRKRNKKSADS